MLCGMMTYCNDRNGGRVKDVKVEKRDRTKILCHLG
jgi:hypothetical protein